MENLTKGTLEAGAVVMLKSGGPEMTYTGRVTGGSSFHSSPNVSIAIVPGTRAGEAICEWFENGKRIQKSFAFNSLMRI